MAKKGRRGSKRRSTQEEWTFLEKAFGVIIVVLILIATYAFTVREEIVEVGTIETYDATVDLRTTSEELSRYSFSRQLKEDYRVRINHKVDDEGAVIRPVLHFHVWNESRGTMLIKDTNADIYERDLRIDDADAGTYEFVWWVSGDSGRLRVDIDVLIQPTEKLFEKRT